MSAEVSRNKLSQFIAEHSEEELMILTLFKFLKNRVISRLESDGKRLDGNVLNQLCLEKAKQFAALGIQPTEDDIKHLVAYLSAAHSSDQS